VTSKAERQECFVYITLPAETDFVTAGRFVLGTDRSAPVGRFVYGKSYLGRDNAVPIDPLALKLAGKTYETRILNGVFGALRDATPDYWGRHVIEKHAGIPQLREIDYMLQSPDDRAGALGFGLTEEPPAPKVQFNQTIELEKLQKIADTIIADEKPPDGAQAAQVNELMLVGTSVGGARPKTVVEDDDALWIAKFNRADDNFNFARVEQAMLALARECGMQVAESKVITAGDRDVLMVKRFDRERSGMGYRRARMLSALTLLRSEDTQQNRERWSYVILTEELRRISSQPRTDAPELFRHMVFNALISNTDDHPRNHAVIALNEDWRLSPAYDLTPWPEIGTERRDLALECGDFGRYANAQNLLSQCERFLVKRDEAARIINEMEKTIAERWHDIARREGVTEKDCRTISTAFMYEGFRLEPGNAVAQR
jgi:serine/threonine-protein kinase HipA